MSIYLHNKRKHQVKDTKEWLQSELQTTLGVCFFNCPYKLNVKMKHGILPGHVIENLPFPFSCPVTEFHKDILAVQGHHQLKTLYFCVDVRMPLWQIHKWYSDTARGQREVKDTPWWFHVPLPHKTRSFPFLIYKDTPWWFHVPLPHKTRSFPFLIYNLDKLMWSTVPKTTEIL